jgi:membrane protease YdiL (CAAX protease family)
MGLFFLVLLLTWFMGGLIQHVHLPVGLLVGEILFIGLPAVLFVRKNRTEIDRETFSRPNPVSVCWTVLIAICVTFIAVYKGLSTRKSLGIDLSPEDMHSLLSPEMFLLVVFLAPVCEELLFRVCLQRSFGRYWKPRNAALASALLFGLFHGSLLRLGETLILGVFAAAVFLRTGCYWNAVILHSVVNCLGPLLFFSATRFQFLLNPAASICFACVAVFGAYQIGPKPERTRKGLRRKMQWALFGHPSSSMAVRPASRWMTAGFWALALPMFAANVWALSLMKQDFGDADFVGKEWDTWHLTAEGDVAAVSRIVLTKSTEEPGAMSVSLPYAEAEIRSASIDGAIATFERVEDGRYEIEFPGTEAVEDGTLEVVWGCPFEVLDCGDQGYRATLQGLIPVVSFSLSVVLDEGCGFEATEDASLRLVCPFRANYVRPEFNLGSCGIPVREKRTI